MPKLIRGLTIAFGAVCLSGMLGWALVGDPRILIGGYERPIRQRTTPLTDPVGQFVAGVLGSTDDVWDGIFSASGKRYRHPILVLYRNATYAGCGIAENIMGPFYCIDDQKVYLDTSFFQEIELQYHACDEASSACKFADAYVIAHEIGHHVQNLLGITPKLRKLQREVGTLGGKNQLQVRLELQADCLAGIWGHQVKERFKVNATDLAAAFRTLEAIGNDTLQKAAFGTTIPDSFTHGTARQRHYWFDVGYTTGTFPSCNTFAGELQ
jgi:uncharacterized protein